MTAQIDIHDAQSRRRAHRSNIVLAVSVAAVTVLGTGTIAWSALSMALGPQTEAFHASDTAPVKAHAPARQAALHGFAERTRAQIATPAEITADPVVLQGERVRTRGASALSAAVQPELFGSAQTSVPQDRDAAPSERSSHQGATEPASPAKVTATASPSSSVSTSEKKRRLKRLWSVGLFR